MSRRQVVPALPSGPPAALLLAQVLVCVRKSGGDVDGILRNAGIPATALGDSDSGSEQPLSDDQFVAAYRECLELLESRHARRSGRRSMGPLEFRLLCYCMISSATLGQAIERASDFCKLLDGGVGEFSLQVRGAIAEFWMHTAYSPRDVHMIFGTLTGLSSFARLFGWMVGKDLAPLTVKVCYENVLDDHVVSWLLPWQVEYEAEDNILCFPVRYLTLPVVRSAAELDELLATFPFDLAAGRASVAPASARVRQIFATALARRSPPPTTVRVAAQLGVSVATLKRRLNDEGTSVRELKEQCRFELANDLLQDRNLTLGDIAARLGFSDAASLSRAFKAWTGHLPSALREDAVPQVSVRNSGKTPGDARARVLGNVARPKSGGQQRMP